MVHGLQRKFMFWMLTLGVLPLLLQGFLTTKIASDSILENNRVIADKDLEKMAVIDTDKLRNFSNFLSYLTQEETLLSYLKDTEERNAGGHRIDIEAFMRTNKVSFAADYAYEYLFVSENGTLYSNQAYLSEDKRKELTLQELEAPWVEALSFHYAPSVWIGVSRKIALGSYRPDYIYLATNIVNDSDYLGRAAIGFNPRYLQGDLDQAKITDNTDIYILDDNNDCVIECSGNRVPYEQVRPAVDNFISGQDKATDSKNLILAKSISLPGTDMQWHIVSVTPYADFNMRISNIRTISFILLLLAVFCVVLICYLMHRDIFTPVKSLQHAMETVVDGNFDVTVSDPGTDELAALSEGFLFMQTQLKTKIEQVRESEITKKKLELQILHEQINPHFIGNSLNTIKIMADLNQDLAVSKALQALHHLVSHYLRGSESIISLAGELDYLQEYLYLQKLRYHNSFSYTLQTDTGNLDPERIGIMKLLLQPLVENAIIHGFSDRHIQGKLDIFASIGKETTQTGQSIRTILIRIADNGCGISDETIASLLRECDEASPPVVHIGIRNVQQRILMEYGNTYGLTFENRNGTCVTVKLPLILLDQPKEETLC